ncbi:SKP1-like protein 13 [Carica papaya]|uniref:SKP1-like protein 13 n=1 Tax=Carica papaya TaxID=3649 RepID=UPI000B8CD8B3|nr:SKP1-like protein 13 [Carica papaya]
MASGSGNKKTITLITGDGKYVEVEEKVAMEFAIVKSFFEDNSFASSTKKFMIPVPNVSAEMLEQIVSYVNGILPLRSKTGGEKEIEAYNRAFVEQLSLENLKDMMLAANYLDIRDLIDLLCQGVADGIKNKSVEFVRKFFGIENDYTEEEEAELRRQNAWAFEDVDPDP